MRVAVLGAGSWGTALALLLAGKGLEIALWDQDAELLARVRADRENRRYLPGHALPEAIVVADSVTDAVSDAEAVVLAVPSSGVRSVAVLLRDSGACPRLLVNAGKGLEEESGLRMSEVLGAELQEQLARRAVALSGPNLAVELAKRIPTATVVASQDAESAAAAQELFSACSLRVYRSTDIVGVELGGALKNIFAIGAGISDGLGYGDNTKATLVTRGLAEMTRLGLALGADPRTLTGLSGVGDLMATCASSLSRNWRLGNGLGRGVSVNEALAEIGQVAEGMPTCRAAHNLAQRLGVDMPITEQIYSVLFESKPPQQAVQDLMSREQKEECVWPTTCCASSLSSAAS